MERNEMRDLSLESLKELFKNNYYDSLLCLQKGGEIIEFVECLLERYDKALDDLCESDELRIADYTRFCKAYEQSVQTRMEDLEHYRQDVAELKRKMESYQNSCEDLSKEVDICRDNEKYYKVRAQEAYADFHTLENKYAELQKENASLKKGNEELKKKNIELQAIIDMCNFKLRAEILTFMLNDLTAGELECLFGCDEDE